MVIVKKKRRDLLIFGAGNHAAKIVEIARNLNFNILGYISTEKPNSMINNLPVLGDLEYYIKNEKFKDISIHIAIGENSVRYKIYNKLPKERQKNLINLLSKDCFISNDVSIMKGTNVIKNVSIHNNVKIGKCCIIDTGAIIEHGTIIGNFVNVSPGAILSGDVRVNDGAIIGAGVTIIEKVSIGKNTLIGAGSAVLHDIEPNVVAVGSPAKVIRKRTFFETYLR